MNKYTLDRLVRYLCDRELDLERELNAKRSELQSIRDLLNLLKIEKEKKREIDWEKEIIKIMENGNGPFTKTMILKSLDKKFAKDNLYHQDIMKNLSIVLVNNPKFKRVKRGWYQLTK